MSIEENGHARSTRHSFEARGRTISADRVGKFWTLTVGDQVVTTRDLPGGVDELLGRARTNFAVVLRILEADAKTMP
jgi:hypothetical protein